MVFILERICHALEQFSSLSDSLSLLGPRLLSYSWKGFWQDKMDRISDFLYLTNRAWGLQAYDKTVLSRSFFYFFLLFFYYITGYGEKEDPNKRRCSFIVSQESSKEKERVRAELNRWLTVWPYRAWLVVLKALSYLQISSSALSIFIFLLSRTVTGFDR